MFNKYEIIRNDNGAVVGYVYEMNIVSAEIRFRENFSRHDFKWIFKEGISARYAEKQNGYAICLL